MKKLLALLLLCAFCVSFAACQPTPDEPFVVSKGDGKLLGTIYGESAPELTEPYQAIEHWTENIDGKVEDRLTIEVDADVHVPDVLNYPVYDVKYADYNQESFEKLLTAVVGDADFYTRKSSDNIYLSVKEAQYVLDIVDYQLNDPSSPFNKYVIPYCAEENKNPEDYRSQFLGYQEKYEKLANHNSDFLEKIDKNYNAFVNAADTLYTSDGDIKLTILRTEGESSAIYFEFGYLTTESLFDESGVSAKNKKLIDMNLSEESARALADEWRDKLGYNDWLIANVASTKIRPFESLALTDGIIVGIQDGEPGEYDIYDKILDNKKEAYLFTYTPALEGVQTLYFSNKYDNQYTNKDWVMPSLSIVVDNDGVKGLSITNANVRFGECLNTNVALLPFDKIQQKFRDYIVMNTDFSGKYISPHYDPDTDSFNGYDTFSQRDDENHAMTRLHIDDIRLGYIKIKKQNTDESMLVPAWCFYGQEFNKFNQDDTTGEGGYVLDENGEAVVETPAGHSFLCINAIDGSIIDLTEGY